MKPKSSVSTGKKHSPPSNQFLIPTRFCSAFAVTTQVLCGFQAFRKKLGLEIMEAASAQKNLRAHAEGHLSGGFSDETRHQESREIAPSQSGSQESNPGEASGEENRESGDTGKSGKNIPHKDSEMPKAPETTQLDLF
jgi:hypothetical protein